VWYKQQVEYRTALPQDAGELDEETLENLRSLGYVD
jgi:hypothetical protein